MHRIEIAMLCNGVLLATLVGCTALLPAQEQADESAEAYRVLNDLRYFIPLQYAKKALTQGEKGSYPVCVA